MYKENIVFVRCQPETDVYCQAITWLLRVAPLLVLGVGTFGNLLTFAVLTRKKLRQQASFVFLLFLSVFDCVCLWTAITRISLLQILDIDLNTAANGFCQLTTLLGITTQTVSLYIMSLIAIDRAVCISYPFRYKYFFSRKGCVISVMIVTICITTVQSIFAFGVGSPRSFPPNITSEQHPQPSGSFGFPGNNEHAPHTNTDVNGSHASTDHVIASHSHIGHINDSDSQLDNNNGTQPDLDLRNADRPDLPPLTCSVISDSFGPNTRYVAIGVSLITFAIPMCVILVSNAVIIRKTIAHYRARATLTTSSSSATHQNTATRICVGITVFYFITGFPYTVLTTYLHNAAPGAIVYTRTVQLIEASLFVWMLFNHACNFILYLWTGSTFRDECRLMIREWRRYLGINCGKGADRVTKENENVESSSTSERCFTPDVVTAPRGCKPTRAVNKFVFSAQMETRLESSVGSVSDP